ncbi:MAG: porin [Chromatiales bacterium]|nr:porin [Chromatiales bacterium]
MRKTFPHTPRLLPVACGITLLGLSTQALSSGFGIPEISILGLGTSNAVVANPDELGAIPYNPAAAVYHPTSLSGGLMAIVPDLSVTTVTGSHDSDGKSIIAIPQFQATYRLNDRTAFGLGLSAPFGLETNWDETAPVFPGLVGIGHPTLSKVEIIDLSPTVAYKLTDNFSVSGGLDYYYLRTVEFNADVIDNEGDGDAFGWNLGLLFTQDNVSVGVSYHSGADIDIKGSSHIPSAMLTVPATAELELPTRLQAGIRVEATDKLALEFDITRTGWSSFDVLEIKNPVSTVTSINNWDDATAYRLGGTYQLNNKTQLRFGYSFDQTGQNDDFFSARVPDADRHLFSVGFGHDMGDGWTLEGGYMYVRFKDRTHSATGFTAPGEPNGSLLYNGEYKSNVNLLGLGISKTFM